MECILNQVDPQFETTQGINYRLSILLCQDGFSLLVTHNVSRKILKLASYKLTNSDIQYRDMGGWPLDGRDYFNQLKATDVFQLPYQRVDIAVASSKITIAPQQFLKPDSKNEIISAAYPVASGEEILTEPVFDLGPAIAILFPRYIAEYCEKLFPGSILHSSAAVFVKGVIRNHSQLISRQVFITVYQGHFEIAVIQGLRLLYLNAFKYSSPSDVLYYVIFVLEQLGFIPAEEKVTLMGDINEDSTISSQLKMYCAKLDFAEKPEGIEYGEAFGSIAMHTYFTLLNIPLCE